MALLEGLTLAAQAAVRTASTRDFRNVTGLGVLPRPLQVSILLPAAFSSWMPSYRDLDSAMVKYRETTNEVQVQAALVPIHAFCKSTFPHFHISTFPHLPHPALR